MTTIIIFVLVVIVMSSLRSLGPMIAVDAQETVVNDDSDNGDGLTELYDISEPTFEHPDGLEVTLTYKVSSQQVEDNIKL